MHPWLLLSANRALVAPGPAGAVVVPYPVRQGCRKDAGDPEIQEENWGRSLALASGRWRSNPDVIRRRSPSGCGSPVQRAPTRPRNATRSVTCFVLGWNATALLLHDRDA
jgi:hypothetical protein